MTIPHFKRNAFDPDEIRVLCTAYAQACRSLGSAKGTPSDRNIVAAKIIECAQRGERNAARLCDYAVNDHATTTELAAFARETSRRSDASAHLRPRDRRAGA